MQQHKRNKTKNRVLLKVILDYYNNTLYGASDET